MRLPIQTFYKKSNYKSPLSSYLPPFVLLPLSGGTLMVEEGERVEEGQLLEKADIFNGESVNFYSPVPGKVNRVAECTLANGRKCEALKITLSGKFSRKNNLEREKEGLSLVQIKKELKEKGILNTFNAAHPVPLSKAIKINKEDVEDSGKILVVRLFDEEKSSYADTLASKFFLHEIQKAALFFAKLTECEKIIFVADKTDKSYFPRSSSAPEDGLQEEAVFVRSSRFPVATRVALSMLLKMEINKEENIFVDASSMLSFYREIILGRGTDEKFIHVSGDAVTYSSYIKVKIGTPIKYIVKMLHGNAQNIGSVIINGMIRGFLCHSLNAPITGEMKSILFLRRRIKSERRTECSLCGKCRAACPFSLFPAIIYSAVKNRTPLTEIEKLAAALCGECGLCDALCPARLPLCAAMKSLKKETL